MENNTPEPPLAHGMPSLKPGKIFSHLSHFRSFQVCVCVCFLLFDFFACVPPGIFLKGAAELPGSQAVCWQEDFKRVGDHTFYLSNLYLGWVTFSSNCDLIFCKISRWNAWGLRTETRRTILESLGHNHGKQHTWTSFSTWNAFPHAWKKILTLVTLVTLQEFSSVFFWLFDFFACVFQGSS